MARLSDAQTNGVARHRMPNVVDISRVAGHKNLKTTMGYVHTADDRLHQTVANMPTIGTLRKDRSEG